jgi:hypothetical protein
MVMNFWGLEAQNPSKMEKRPVRKKMRVVGRCIYSHSLTKAGIIRPTASINHPLTEAVVLAQPPSLID